MQSRTLAVAFLAAATLLNAQADNTERNKRDRAEGASTAGQRGESEADREITRKVRKALTDDENLSTYVKNVNEVTRDGRVTLKGLVNSEEEKRSLEKFAVSVAGQASLSSQIEVVKKGKEQ